MSDGLPPSQMHDDVSDPQMLDTTAGAKAAPTTKVKKRAPKACLVCQTRKVRCDIDKGGKPCTNCRLDEKECIETVRRKRRKNRPKEETIKRPLEYFDHGLQGKILPPLPQPSALPPLNVGLPSPEERRVSLPSHPSHPSLQSRSSLPSHGSSNSVEPPQLPPFIKPLSDKVGADEIAYLQRKGALTLPHYDLCTELLRSYIAFMHFTFPILDLNDFLLKFQHTDGSHGTISLLLFQAVMYAGIAAADENMIKAAGFTNKREARQIFFMKARRLFDFDAEMDRIPLTQALLLLGQYYETPDSAKDTWHWSGVATAYAQSLGLDRNPIGYSIAQKKVGLWKRIWWAIFTLDCFVSLGVRRPMRLNADDIEVPLITLEDFDLRPIPDEITCIPANFPLRDLKNQKKLAMININCVKLCIQINRLLKELYHIEPSRKTDFNDKTALRLHPKILDMGAYEVQTHSSELQRWFGELPDDLKHLSGLTGVQCLDIPLLTLHGTFHWAMAAVYRTSSTLSSLSKGSSSEESASMESIRMSREMVRSAASSLTEISKLLDSRQLVNRCPSHAITIHLPAIVSQLLDVRETDLNIQLQAAADLAQCVGFLSQLRTTYAAAGFALIFIRASSSHLGLDLDRLIGNSPRSGHSGSSQDEHDRAEPQPSEAAVRTFEKVSSQTIAAYLESLNELQPPSPDPNGMGTDHPGIFVPSANNYYVNTSAGFYGLEPPDSAYVPFIAHLGGSIGMQGGMGSMGAMSGSTPAASMPMATDMGHMQDPNWHAVMQPPQYSWAGYQ